ncbi:hypothetical protein T310_8229 [Rasamsonia emersonii CBS 393.64]|uniref:Uncharacterized protein n=1 Tax=Rasamsonia emersonii (strain ATCC 16479 / CBS 393.64 / IMI 116815) TaxID=1408163 RepID=A0A0F4YIX2_RASE3|nr:hypothetical protein T310_8229 [Rasamsonia emersonii CBS 393.64]KKA17826.1 hypothetical protein T310_8229 [Rasamsonia emersonii CBS 393.64]
MLTMRGDRIYAREGFSSIRLGELAACADLRTLPVEDINRDGDEEGQTSQDGTRPLQVELLADVAVHERRVHGRNARQEITRETVAARCRCRIDALAMAIRQAKISGAIQGVYSGPMDVHAKPKRPIVSSGARKSSSSSRRRSGRRSIALLLPDVPLAGETREEDCIRQQITDDDGNESQPGGDGAEVPLRKNRVERLNTGKNQSIKESRQKRQEQHDWVTDEHLKGSPPDAQELFRI